VTDPADAPLASSRGARWPPGRSRVAAAATLGLLVGMAFVGRAVITPDAAEVLSETLGFLVQGRFEAARPPGPVTADDPARLLAFHSKYGLFASLVPLPFAAAAWPFRARLGPGGFEAVVALTWAAGVLLCALAFVRLARALEPDASPWWGPALVAGTYLWPYAADSYLEPWAAAGVTWSAATILGGRAESPLRSGLLAGASLALACALKPFLWPLAPLFVLAVSLRVRRGVSPRFLPGFLLAHLAVLAAVLAANLARFGSILETGYSAGALWFSHPLLAGLFGLTLSPGRGLVFYAPVAALALFAARRLPAEAKVLCLGVPLVTMAVVARWWAWHGASCWGPRLVLPVLPLLVAPAVFLGLRLVAPFVALGALLNLGGILVAPGAFITYVEGLRPPPGANWPENGSDRVSSIPFLSPLLGHPWLFLDGAGVKSFAAPWLKAGAREGFPRPSFENALSPLVLRRALGIPPARPVLLRLLVQLAGAYAVRGRPASAHAFLAEALRLSPSDPDALQLQSALGP